MRKIASYLPLFFIVLFVSCKSPKYIAPAYTSTSDILKIKGGMSIEAVSSATGLEPYDFYENSSNQTVILVYKYRLKDRRRTILTDKQLHNEEGQTPGETWYQTDEKELYVTYKNGKVANFITKNGRKHGENLAVLDNNIRKIQKEQLNSYVIYWQKLLEDEARRKAKTDTIIVVRENLEEPEEPTATIIPTGKSKKGRKTPSPKFFSLNSAIGLLPRTTLDGDLYKKSPMTAFEMEVGGNKSATGIYFAILYGAPLNGDVAPSDGHEKYITRMNYGIQNKYYLAPMLSKVRPYIRLGVGFSSYTINETWKETVTKNYTYPPYSSYTTTQTKTLDTPGTKMHFLARAGVEIFPIKWVGITLETGYGGMSVFQLGLNYRFGAR